MADAPCSLTPASDPIRGAMRASNPRALCDLRQVNLTSPGADYEIQQTDLTSSGTVAQSGICSNGVYTLRITGNGTSDYAKTITHRCGVVTAPAEIQYNSSSMRRVQFFFISSSGSREVRDGVVTRIGGVDVGAVGSGAATQMCTGLKSLQHPVSVLPTPSGHLLQVWTRK